MKLVKKILNILNLESSFRLLHKGALIEDGWFNSVKKKQSVDKSGNPIPWFSYPSIDFIKSRLNKNMIVFEYGYGGSSQWFAEKVLKIYSVEHNKEWIEIMNPFKKDNMSVALCEIPENCKHLDYDTLAFFNDSNKYTKDVEVHNEKFDIIIIDGIFRNICTEKSISFLKDDGIFILDNTDLLKINPSIDFLTKNGFKRIDFWGMMPIYQYKTCTSIFYRSNNCLNI